MLFVTSPAHWKTWVLLIWIAFGWDLSPHIRIWQMDMSLHVHVAASLGLQQCCINESTTTLTISIKFCPTCCYFLHFPKVFRCSWQLCNIWLKDFNSYVLLIIIYVLICICSNVAEIWYSLFFCIKKYIFW